MVQLAFGEYRPDLNDLNGEFSSSIQNVVPRADGYGPFKSFEEFTDALPARCRGYFFATKTDETIAIYAGTATKLYLLDNTTFEWSDVSLGAGTYTSVSAQARWEFAQFNDKVIAVQVNAAPQVVDVNSGGAFADLGGSPPQAAHITILNRFVILSGILDNPNRVVWSALNDITGWTAGTSYSDYQDLPDGGALAGVVGGELGIIIQEGAVRRMIYQPGSEIIFSIDRIANNVGCIAPHSITYVNNKMFWLSARGFVSANQNGEITFIGRERVDRTFLADYDSAQKGLVFGSSDPQTHLVLFTYKSLASALTTQFDKALAYDWLMDRWTPLDLVGEFVAELAKPGFTLESLDTIGSVVISGAADNGAGLVRLTVASSAAWTTGDIKVVAEVTGTTEANGSHTITVIDATHIDLQGSTFANAYVSGGYVAGSIDDLPVSLDAFDTATLPAFSMVDTTFKLGFFTGANLEATLETAEQSAVSKRMFVRGFYPITDADAVVGAIGSRENLNATPVYSTEQAINTQGFVPARVSTRAGRARITISAGDEWTYATAVEPDVGRKGRR